MENRQQQILSEIQELMSSVRSQLERLDAKMLEFQQTVDPQGDAAAPIDLEIDESYFLEEVVTEVGLDLPPAIEDVPEPVVEPEPAVVPEPVPEEGPAVVAEPARIPEPMPVVEPVPDEDDDDLPLFAEPEPIFEVAQKATKARKAVVDVMEDRQAWRTDMPGAPVKDILSAISLNDRVQFINQLFNGDPALFQQARAQINSMETLDQAVDYVTSGFNWDMGSQVVYRFMMAVRRKVR